MWARYDFVCQENRVMCVRGGRIGPDRYPETIESMKPQAVCEPGWCTMIVATNFVFSYILASGRAVMREHLSA